MSAGDNQRLKLIYLEEIFRRETDENHGLTVAELADMLSEKGVNAERRTLYKDIEALRIAGMDINTTANRGPGCRYWLGQRDFELPELRLMVDSVQAARFMTEAKSRELIEKIEGLTSRHEARRLHRQVYLTGKVKSDNRQIYYSIFRIQDAIDAGRRITFRYWQWDTDKRQKLRRDGEAYEVTPLGLVWDSEYYYLIARMGREASPRQYRVDKMKDIEITEAPGVRDTKADAAELAAYTSSLFGMYSGEQTDVTLLCRNSMAGVIIDRFGKSVMIIPRDEEHFTVSVKVALSPQFLGWITGLEGAVTVAAPEKALEKMRELAAIMQEQYLK